MRRHLDADLAWQPELWRALVGRHRRRPPHIRHEKTIARLREGPADLPARLSLFGHTRLACTEVELLDALATHHDLHLWLPHPSDDLWQALGDIHGAVAPREDTSRREAAHHPLLETLGRDLRELQRSTAGLPSERRIHQWRNHTRHAAAAGCSPTSPPMRSGHDGRVMAETDRSVQVHSCHGSARQIDVLREVLLGLLEDDPTLEPRDIVVMCPDIETYAPLIVAGFGLGERGARRPPGTPTAGQARRPLAHPDQPAARGGRGVTRHRRDPGHRQSGAQPRAGRAGARPVRFHRRRPRRDHRLGARIEYPVGFRRREHREPYGLERFVHNTWRFGLDRILAGVAMSDDSQAWLGTALPLDDVGSNSVQLAGQLAEFVDRLQRVVEILSGAPPLTKWLDALTEGVGLLTRIDDRRLARRPAAAGIRRRLEAGRFARVDTCCGCPTSARCWTDTWPDARRVPTSAPAR